jgi:phage tail tape-measure protein
MNTSKKKGIFILIRELITKLGFQIDDAAIKRFDSSMASLASRAQGLGDKLSSIGQKMSLAFTLPIVGAGAFALKTAGEFEQTQIAFDTMLGSAEKSKAFLDTLFDFAANTPFEIGDLTDASKRFTSLRPSI